MSKEIITNRQGFTLLVTFTMCNAYSLLFGASIGRDLWLAYLFAAILAILIWATITKVFERNPDLDFFSMMDYAFGKILGHIITFILLVYAFLSCTTSMSLFGRFAQLTALPKTPQIILPLLILLLAAWALKSGLEVLARGASLLFYFIITTFIYFVIFSLPLINLRNILPILQNGILPPLKSALTIFTNQFGDVLLLLAIYPNIRRAPARRKTMMWAMVASGLAMFIISTMTVFTLGGKQTSSEFFPVFSIMAIRNIGGYIQHTEILTSIAMTFFVFIRQTLCLYFIAKGFQYLFHTTAYQRLLTPLALLTVSGTQLLYSNMVGMIARIEGDQNLYLILPLQLLLPLLVCVFILIKNRKHPNLE